MGVGTGRVPGGGVAFKTLAKRRRRGRFGARSGDDQAGRYGGSQSVLGQWSLEAECGDGGLASLQAGAGRSRNRVVGIVVVRTPPGGESSRRSVNRVVIRI